MPAADADATLREISHALQLLKAEIGPLFTDSLHGSLRTEAMQRIDRVLDYTIAGGKFARSCLVLNTFGALKPDAAAEERRRVAQVALIMEIVSGFLCWFVVISVITRGVMIKIRK